MSESLGIDPLTPIYAADSVSFRYRYPPPANPSKRSGEIATAFLAALNGLQFDGLTTTDNELTISFTVILLARNIGALDQRLKSILSIDGQEPRLVAVLLFVRKHGGDPGDVPNTSGPAPIPYAYVWWREKLFGIPLEEPINAPSWLFWLIVALVGVAGLFGIGYAIRAFRKAA